MAGYMPVHQPGDVITLTASATITAGQHVIVTGSGTVGPSTASAATCVGVAAMDAAANATVTIYGRGQVHEVVNSGGITAGARVDCGTAGKAVTAAAHVNNVGIALTTATDGNLVRYMEI